MDKMDKLLEKRNELIEYIIFNELSDADLSDVIVTHRDFPLVSETIVTHKGEEVGRKIITNFHDLTVRYE